MGMTIDESNRILVDRYIDTYVVCGGENYNPAINITRQDCDACWLYEDDNCAKEALYEEMEAESEDT